jgi:peroxiredoxin
MASFKQRRRLEAGVQAPDFRLQRLAGAEVSLRELTADGPALIVFFKISCPVCQFTFPYLERIYRAGYRIYGISQNDAEDTLEFVREFELTLPILLDEEDAGFPVSNAYGISQVPTMFLVEPGQTIARASDGWQAAEIEWLGAQAGIRVIREGEKVPAWKAG